MTRTKETFLRFSPPDIQEDEMAEVMDTLRDGWLGTGPKVARFEHAFEDYMGQGHAVAVSSCTAALHLSMLAAGLGPGDEVITTPMTFCATVNAILHVGARPVLVDVDPDTMNIDPEGIKNAITPKTKALLPVHFAGRPCDMATISELATDHGLTLVEDAAHAIEAEYGGRKTGTFGDFGCFSFYATKNLAMGEGGMALVRDSEQAERLRRLSLHGLSRDAWKRYSSSGFSHYQVTEPGFKYNMMDIQAAIGIHQLARLEAMSTYREQLWRRYDDGLRGAPCTSPAAAEPQTRHARHLYTILVDDDAPVSRDEFLASMTTRNIGVGVHYRSVAEHPYYQEALGWKPDAWPHAADIGRRTVSLPLSARLTPSDVDDVLHACIGSLAGDHP